MEFVLYSIFKLRLAFTLLTELFLVAVRLSIGTKTFLLSVFMSLILIADAVLQMTTYRPTLPQVHYEKNRQDAETQIVYWENLAATNPSREIFLNLEKLYRYLNEPQQAALYRKRAFTLDPNNVIFKNDHWDAAPVTTSSASAGF